MEVVARQKYLRTSPRKVRLLLPELQGLPAEEALAHLRLTPQAAARPLAKLIKSALANAEHNFSLDPKTMVIRKLTADGGPVIKRYQPRARGSASNIWRRTAHITLILQDIPKPTGRLGQPRAAGKGKQADAKQPKPAATKKPASQDVRSTAKPAAKPGGIKRAAAKEGKARVRPATGQRSTSSPQTVRKSRGSEG